MRAARAGVLVTFGCMLLLGGGSGRGSAPVPTAAALSPAPASAAPATGRRPPARDSWSEVDRLIKEQKLEQAAVRIEAIRAAAERRGDAAAWTRALVRATDVRIALGGFETAVRQLKEARWPPGVVARTGLDLYFAHALTSYLAAYSWEINRRERVETGAKLDLGLWTREQIVAAATAAYLAAWQNRAALGAEPAGSLGDVVVANNYPAAVRGTLRDAVSYLFVELLADASLWTPDEANDLYRLDLSRL
ncbi:MAG: hypothetical protein JOZ15_16595, partial [Acidobacteria bacterium]|nr:hypothetical protein [Acidobacteriota bacterium]